MKENLKVNAIEASGVFETTKKHFSSKAKEKMAGTVLQWNLQEVLPDFFCGTTTISKTLHIIWRQVLDEVIKEGKENRGLYYHAEGAVIYVFFEKIGRTDADVKLARASLKLKQALKARQDQSTANLQEDETKTAKEHKKVGGDEALSKVIQQGLTGTASFKEFNFWADRVSQDIHMLADKNSLPDSLLELSRKVGCGFYPLWNASAKAIAGNFATVISTADITGESKGLQFDTAVLTTSCMEGLRLIKSNITTLIIIPVSLKSFHEKSFSEIYTNILRHINPAICKLLVFELKDMSRSITPQVKRTIEALQPYCRAIIINTGILSQPNYDFNGFKPHAYGFDLKEIISSMSEDELILRMRKYSEHYKRLNTKIFVRSLPNANMATKAESFGFIYLSGSAIAAPQKHCIGVKPVPLKTLLNHTA